MASVLIMILQGMWLLLPAAVANIAPVLVKKINFLNSPVDFGATFFGKSLFGRNKTWRGFFFGVLAGLLFIFVQRSAESVVVAILARIFHKEHLFARQYLGILILIIGMFMLAMH